MPYSFHVLMFPSYRAFSIERWKRRYHGVIHLALIELAERSATTTLKETIVTTTTTPRFRKVATRVGAALAIAALALAGITGTQLAASAAEVTTEPPQWLADATDTYFSTLDEGEWATPLLQNAPTGTGVCLEVGDPSVYTGSNGNPVIIFQSYFASIEAYDAANGVYTYDLNQLACAEQWDLTGNWTMAQNNGESGSYFLWSEFRTGTGGVIETPSLWNVDARDRCADALASGTAAGCGSASGTRLYLERSDGSVVTVAFYAGFRGVLAPPVDPDPTTPVLTAELFMAEVGQYGNLTIAPEDLIVGCALDGVVEDCAADRAYFVSLPLGNATTTVRGDGSQEMEYFATEAGDFSFQFVIWDSALGIYSEPQQGIIRVNAMPDFLGTATAPSKEFTIGVGEEITITHDMLGDVLATAFEGDEPVLIDPWIDVDGERLPHWRVVYLDAPSEDNIVTRPALDGTGEPISELVFSSATVGTYRFTYRIEIDSKSYGFVTPPITSIINVVAAPTPKPDLPKVTG
jgi:hypothetical protein